MALFEPAPNRRSLASQLIWVLLWLAVTIFGLAMHPSRAGHGTHTQLGLPPCPSVLLFDRPCPGCGLTTSWTALLHGDFALAFHAHPLGPLVYLCFTVTAFACAWGWFHRMRLMADTPKATRFLVAFAVTFFIFGLGRMALVSHYRTAADFAALR